MTNRQIETAIPNENQQRAESSNNKQNSHFDGDYSSNSKPFFTLTLQPFLGDL